MTHELKIYHEPFCAVIAELKRAEFRRLDRDYKVGDLLRLREYDLGAGSFSWAYTGREVWGIISHITTGFGIPDGWGMISFALHDPKEAPREAP